MGMKYFLRVWMAGMVWVLLSHGLVDFGTHVALLLENHKIDQDGTYQRNICLQGLVEIPLLPCSFLSSTNRRGSLKPNSHGYHKEVYPKLVS